MTPEPEQSDYLEVGLDLLLKERETAGERNIAEGLRIVEEDHGATPTYMLVLDIGWAEKIIAQGMYERDARGVAFVLGAAMNCEVEGR